MSPACAVPKASGPLVKVPLFAPGSAACPIALVGDSVITVGELTEALAASHERRGEKPSSGGAKQPEMDFTPALDRLIETRLVVAEAHDMGLDALPEVRSQLDDYRASLQKTLLERKATAGIHPDALEVERAYREVVREWKVKSVLFEKPDDAKAALALLASGKKLDDVAQQMIKENKAEGSADAEWLSARRMLPEIKAAIDALPIGTVSDLVKVPNGHVVLRVDGIRYPDDPKTKAEAQEQSVSRQKRAALKRFYASLTRKYATVDKRLLDKLDWEAPKPGFAALAKDRRVVATIRGGEAITVAELTAGIGEKFFHGIEGPIREHRVNLQKMEVFSSMLDARLVRTEAAARRLEQTEAFRRAVDEQRRGMAFGKFIEKVLIPDLKVTEAEARKYFDEHQRDYTYPQIYRLESLGFATAKGAQTALAKLRAGTDLKWLRANAEGQLQPQAQSVQLDGSSTVTATALPPGVARTLTGAVAGEYRVHEGTPSEHYVIHVLEEFPAKLQPYEEAREAIGRKLQAEHLRKALGEYAEKLRKVHPVQVFVTRIGA